MRGHRHLALVLVLASFGCFNSNQPNDSSTDGGADALVDSSVLIDAQLDEAHLDADGGPIGRCDPIGGIQQCWPDCEACSDGTGCSRAPSYALCTGDVLGCFGEASYCVEPKQYCFRGTCMAAEFCADLHRSELEDRCTYNAGEIYLTGPPVEACPAPLDSLSTFCGEDCAPCSTEPIVLGGSFGRCVGLNDERGLGLCGLSTPCDASSGPTLDLYNDFIVDPICLVELGESGLQPLGYVVAESACVAYVERYPGDFACVDPREGWRVR